ncbi:MAG: transporter substrate-binding domain-containing protein, partial [Promicromonosporaceae bacterium]|nr:transporter substrate-binding domain-containing protein [Promicromonosporaceae bacterium]
MQRFSKQRLLPAALVGLLTLGALGGCRGADDGAPAENVEPALRVGIKFDQPGMGLMTDGHPTGLDVDVAAYIAWKLGYSPYQIEWVEAPSPQREQLLIDGVVDMVIATFTIRESNYGVIDYAGPYLIAGQDILVRTGETSIGSVDDLAGHTVCSVAGTSSIQR